MSTVIKIENLSKKYIIGHQRQEKYTALRDIMMHKLRGLGEKFRHPLSPNKEDTSLEEFWALKDINFEIKQGDRVGIIGRNGAGKSTLLKILSRITEPTTGRITINGRVASLLEVGTGFHPELTGRENIFLNGAILGMGRIEIKKKFDEIVEFAEVEKFIDTPVKRYSSGMYVRLAFAVAAHLEPEILVVDEVLAVGDIQFQKKCLGRMEEASKEGRTILFVSHNMQAIKQLCDRGIILDQGMLATDTQVIDAVARYNKLIRQIEFGENSFLTNKKNRRGSGAVRFTKMRIQNANNQETQAIKMGETIRFALDYKVLKPVEHLYASVVFRCGKTREIVTGSRHCLSKDKLSVGQEGHVVLEFPHVNLRPKEYPLYFWLGDNLGRAFDVVDDILPPIIITTDKNIEELGYDPSEVPGYFNIESRIKTANSHHTS